MWNSVWCSCSHPALKKMTEYHQIVTNLPLPTVEQTRGFAEHVTRAHSCANIFRFCRPAPRSHFTSIPTLGDSLARIGVAPTIQVGLFLSGSQRQNH